MTTDTDGSSRPMPRRREPGDRAHGAQRSRSWQRVPVVVAVKVMFDFASLVDHGEAFSPSTVRLLRRLELLIGITAAHLVLGLLWVWAGLRLMFPGILLSWFAAEVVALFLFTLAPLLQRLFAAALALRQDNELTV